MKPFYQDEYVTIYHSDCLELLAESPGKNIDFVLTDPPYPDQHLEYGSADINFLDSLNCKQLVFWSAKADFPLSYTAIHIWDKQTGCASEYERIFERNGQRNYKVFRAYVINSTIAASYARDTFWGHSSQKPRKLIDKLISDFTRPNDVIFDPFLGSGTTAYCAKKLGRKCIGIEREERWCEVAAQRCSQGVFNLVTDNVTFRRCGYCGMSFNHKRGDAIYCSNRCKQADYRKRLLSVRLSK